VKWTGKEMSFGVGNWRGHYSICLEYYAWNNAAGA
jgi:hypothetical protein